MIYLVLYDNRGQCQRVARVNRREDASAFLAVGFEEVEFEEYDRCATIVPEVTASELPDIQTARDIVNRISTTSPALLQLQANPDALDRLTARQRDKLQTITQAYVDGDRTPEQWYRQMVNAINAGNIASTALAVGGFENISSDDRQQIERDNQTQVRYLNGFRRTLDSLSDAQKVARAGLYAGATTTRYWTAHTRAQGLALPAMPGVRTDCGASCKCNWQIDKLPGDGNWNCRWRLSAVESCDQCKRRQEVFNPLRVRNFIVQPFSPNGIYR